MQPKLCKGGDEEEDGDEEIEGAEEDDDDQPALDVSEVKFVAQGLPSLAFADLGTGSAFAGSLLGQLR